MRLIDTDALKEDHGMKNDCADCDKELRGKSRLCEFERLYTLMDFCGWLDDAPTIEPERKTGKWIHEIINDYTEKTYCSECGEPAPFVYVSDDYYGVHVHGEIKKTNYCPNCGSFNGGADVDE